VVCLEVVGDRGRGQFDVFRALQSTPGATDVYSSASSLSPEVNITCDRNEVEALNIDIGTAAQAVQAAFGSTTATQFQTTAGVESVQVIYPLTAQHSLAPLMALPLTANAGAWPTSAISRPRSTWRGRRSSPCQLARRSARDGKHPTGGRALDGRARVRGAPGAAASAGVRARRPNTSGNQVNLISTIGGIAGALLFSMALVYLLMVALFNSYVSPFIIMFTVPPHSVAAVTMEFAEARDVPMRQRLCSGLRMSSELPAGLIGSNKKYSQLISLRRDSVLVLRVLAQA